MLGEILGGGGFGIVLKTENDRALKLIKNINECESLKQEIHIHKLIEKIIKEKLPKIKVPHIYETFSKVITVEFRENVGENTYLCGILMDKISPLDEFNNIQFHPAFGLELVREEIDRVHYVTNSKEPRGFYGSVDYLVNILESRKLNIDVDDYIENIVILMAKTLRTLLLNGINPMDIEFVVDNRLNLWILDFGLCYEITSLKTIEELKEFLNKKEPYGLKNNMYVPVYSYLKNIFENEFLDID